MYKLLLFCLVGACGPAGSPPADAAPDDTAPVDSAPVDTAPEDTATDEAQPAVPPPDYATLCADAWVQDECAGTCITSDVEQRYADAFVEAFQENNGWTDAQIEHQLRLRWVDHWEALQSSAHRIHAEVTIGWATFVIQDYASAPGADPSYDEILAAWNEYPLIVGLAPDTTLALTPSDIEAEIAACEAELGDPLHESGTPPSWGGWCDPSYSRPDDAPSMQFYFLGDAHPQNRIAQLMVDAVTGEVQCDWTNAWTY